MPRAPFQVLVFPFMKTGTGFRFAVLRRNSATGGYWQGIAGGGEEGERPEEAARREAAEEAGIPLNAALARLDTMTMIPVINVCGFRWGNDVPVIPEYAFGVEVQSESLMLSGEHAEYIWGDIDAVMSLVKWDSNRTALWELNYRLVNDMCREVSGI